MVREFFRGTATEGLDNIESLISDMFSESRHTFDTAAAAVFGGADPATIGDDIRTTDSRINELEREVRRELVVHASVHGASADVPSIMIYMNVVKDIERIGDYSKNIYDLADQGVDLTSGPDHDELLSYRDRISSLISEVAATFSRRDTTGAHELANEGDGLLDEFDNHISTLVNSEATAKQAVPRALLYRYVKRIVAHLLNVLSAVTMPVDQLDYYDEDRETRG
ncbi:MAG: PhoU domain-containing protein [Acidimicrobiia bacterium]